MDNSSFMFLFFVFISGIVVGAYIQGHPIADCTELGICVGDVVVPTDSAKDTLNLTFIHQIENGVKVVKVSKSTGVLTIDKGNNNYDIIGDSWVKHKSNQ